MVVLLLPLLLRNYQSARNNQILSSLVNQSIVCPGELLRSRHVVLFDVILAYTSTMGRWRGRWFWSGRVTPRIYLKFLWLSRSRREIGIWVDMVSCPGLYRRMCTSGSPGWETPPRGRFAVTLDVDR
ncbi:hypothetical protein F5Y15DRAFT_393632 [Xylariaceae sp. FL0016]|nr:hypothetical protein F5Y15DRAFT_393632 [Xylariaceae sp. FL0016]